MFGFEITESAGMSGRLPLLSTQEKVAHCAVQVTCNTWPGVVGVFSLKPPTAAYATSGLVGEVDTSCIGRFGSTLLLSVTSTAVAALAVPRLKMYATLPSLVPA